MGSAAFKASDPHPISLLIRLDNGTEVSHNKGMEATATNTKETSTMSKPVIYYSRYSSANLYTQTDDTIIRQATISELRASVVAAETDGGCGWIIVDHNDTPTIVYAA